MSKSFLDDIWEASIMQHPQKTLLLLYFYYSSCFFLKLILVKMGSEQKYWTATAIIFLLGRFPYR